MLPETKLTIFNILLATHDIPSILVGEIMAFRLNPLILTGP